MSTPMQQLDHLSAPVSTAPFPRCCTRTFVPPDDLVHLPHPTRQLAAHAVRQRVHLAQDLPLLLQLAAHHVRLLPQRPHRLEHAVQRLVLLPQHLDLPLLLHRCHPVASLLPILERRRIRQPPAATAAPTVGTGRHHLAQLVPHVRHLPADGVDQAPPPRHLVHVEPVAEGILLHRPHAVEQIPQVRGQRLQVRLELGARLGELGGGGGGRGGADAQV